MKNRDLSCPLCRSEKVCEFFRSKDRDYYECRNCGLVFLPSTQFLSEDDEKKRYDLHRNSPHDPGYCRYLSRLFIEMQRYIQPGSSGLDFGSGPEPVLALMFQEAGFRMTLFDRFYEPNYAALGQQYDFITASEVVEHLHDPGTELERLWACLKPGGRLGIMTQFAVSRDAFPEWHYKNDLTHVSFFSRPAFAWLARSWNAELTVAESDVVLFYKKAAKNN